MELPVTALIAIAVSTVMTWLVMLLVARLGGKQQGGGFLKDTSTRFMGLIVLAMGVQFALTGFHAFGSDRSTLSSKSKINTHGRCLTDGTTSA